MTPLAYERATELFDVARTLSPGEQCKFLNDACAGDSTLRAAVERLLVSHDRDPDFLAAPLISDEIRRHAARHLLSDQALAPCVDGWRVVRVVGEGGFSRVYLVEEDWPPHRRGALKVLRGTSSSSESMRRLHSEVRVLGTLNHPGIVRVLAAGQLQDDFQRPYFVMEWVEGKSIIAHCEASGLHLTDRVRLWLEVCAPVQHAHLRGILHRDIKPANVLVSKSAEAPVVKVIDFGMARLLDEEGLTADGELIGTLSYMSPEQAEGRADMRSDVYALGALLYELCTGHVPIDVRGCSLAEAGRRLSQESIRPPSTLSPDCPPDLDLILQTALERDPDRRYQSVGELAADARRLLASEPIVARRPSMGYLLRTCARRHRAAIVSAVCALGLIGLGSGALVLENQRARFAEDKWAQRVEQSLRREWELLDARTGTIESRAKLAEDALADARELLARRPHEARYLDLAAGATRRLSNVRLELGDADAALYLRRQALQWRTAALEQEPAAAALLQASAVDLVLLGDACFALGRLDEMRDWFQQSLAVVRSLADAHPTRPNQVRLAWSYQRLGAADLNAGRVQSAQGLLERSIEIAEEILAFTPSDPSALECARQSHEYLAVLAGWEGLKQAVEEHGQAALAHAEQLFKQDPQNRNHAVVLLNAWLAEAGRKPDTPEAATYVQRGYALAAERLRHDPHHEEFLRYTACYALRMAAMAREAGDDAGTLQLVDEALTCAERMPHITPTDAWGLSSIYFDAALFLSELGFVAEQRDCVQKVRMLCEQVVTAALVPPGHQRGCAEQLATLGP